MKIREARSEDLPSLLEIYNHYVEHTHVTFDTERITLVERRRWLDAFSETGPHRLFVASTDENSQTREPLVCGYASSREFRARRAYRSSVETSIYLDPKSRGAGVGTALYAHLLKALEEEASVHRAYGGVALPNDASVAIHRRFGFEQVGLFTDVGFKLGRYWDVAWFERAV